METWERVKIYFFYIVVQIFSEFQFYSSLGYICIDKRNISNRMESITYIVT